MVISTLHKKLFRSMLLSWPQSLGVVAVVMCGIAAYICVFSSYLNLKLTRDTYYAQNRFADFEIMVDRAPETAIAKLKTIPGVSQVRKRIVKDVNVDVPGVEEPRVGRIVSMPLPRRPVINDVTLLAGRYFESDTQNETILSEHFARANGLEIGDRVNISVDNKKYSLRIVGIGASPEYVYMIRDLQSIVPTPERFGVLWVPETFAETALDMKAACNNIVGLANSPEELNTILEAADRMLDSYGVFAKTERENQLSNRFLTNDIKGLAVSARVVPTLFLGIAAMIILILLNRMVRTERTQIGLMKAFGYSNWSVGRHYIEYGVVLACIGCVGGFVLGQWMANGMIKEYIDLYQFPILESRIHKDVLASAIAITMSFATLGALTAAIQAAGIQPAESMRAEAPRSVTKVWIEYFPLIWSRITFTWKMILRNISRNRFRASVNLFGVAVSLTLMLMGRFMSDAITYGMRFQFEDVQRDDVKISFQKEQGPAALFDAGRLPSVRRAEPFLEHPFEIRSAWKKKDVVVTGVANDSELYKVIDFDRQSFELGDHSIILAKGVADALRVGPGDIVELESLMGRIDRTFRVPVRAVARQFVGTAAYMDLGDLSRMLDEPLAMNSALLRIEEDGRAELSRELKGIGGIASVNYNQDSYDSIRNTLGRGMSITNGFLRTFAAVISFSIIYNITAVSLSERQRELASLRVMGFSAAETGRVMYYENILLGLLGIVGGIPMGMGVCALLVRTYTNDMFQMPFRIEISSYAIAILLTFFFVLLANLAMRRKIQQLDLVEVLKERE